VTDTFHFITGAQDTIGNPLAMGEDRYGDLYILYLTHKTVYRLLDTSSQRRPKAYFTPVDQGTGSFLFQGLQGRNLTYQWLRDNVVIPAATSPDYTTSAPGTYTLVVKNILNFSDTSDQFTLGALPLNLTLFTAQKIATGKVALAWKTATERNVSGFTIMRKQNNEPTYSGIGFVNSKGINGNSGTELAYNFIDSTALSNSKIYYRLQILNKDGSFTWSDIRVVTTGGVKNDFTYFPNPAQSQVQIYLDSFVQPVILTIYDNTGKKVKEQTLNQQSTIVGLEPLRGVYIVQIGNKDGSNVIRKKLVVH
ncbi:MAG: T9SS type A sorting domain-containing protein, partial [Ginsengibacter sp.]